MTSYKRNVYLDTVDLDEAQHIIKTVILKRCKRLEKEIIPVEDSFHRVTTKAVFSVVSSPYYNAAAMDGIAVIAHKTHTADLNSPIELIKDVDFVYINTGDPIEPSFDAVIMIEDLIDIKGKSLTINKPCSQFQHIRPIGEDIVANEMVIPAKHKIRPVDIAAMIAGGVKTISVYKEPIVSIIPTGDEIISDPLQIEKGKIIDSNSHFIKNSVSELDGIPIITEPVKDNYETIKSNIINAVKNSQLVIVVAGSSSGSKDYTAAIIKEIGEVYVHGIAIKPGKPVIIGMINNVPVIGIPGYPVSAYIAFEQVVKPILNGLYHQSTKENIKVKAILTKKIYSSLKNIEFVRVKLGYVNNQLITTPLSRGAGVTMSLVNADGILLIDKKSEGYEPKAIVEVELLKDIKEIENTIVSIGSHDIVLDYIANILREEDKETRLSSAHVGSFSGIMAIKRGECHIAPIHILDADTGVYNLPILNKYFNIDDVVLLKGIKREQGLMIRKDNDKNILSIDDLKRDDITFINRQKGSGTRILFDYLLSQRAIEPKLIKGYEFEVTTHMMVASSVFSNTVDCGLGVRSAAQIFDLDFIPIGYEDYDFLILKSALNSKQVKDFICVLKGDKFKEIVMSLGGYKIDHTGEIIEIKDDVSNAR